jgi:phosphate transport system substrate-binding protein
MKNFNYLKTREIGVATTLLLAVVSCILLNPWMVVAEVIRIGGTGSGLGTMRLLATEFEKIYPDIRVKVLPSIGSYGAISAISKDALEIGLISRKLKQEELKIGLRVTEFSRTPFVLVAEKHVPVSNLSHEDLVKIYCGEMKSWPNGERIRIILRPAADTDNLVASGISPQMSAAIDKALSWEGMLMALTNQEAMDIIEKTPGAIGFSSLAQFLSEWRTAKVLSYNGVFPNSKSFLNGTYPLSLQFALITRPDRSPAVQRFINFVQSPQGRSILGKSGCYPTMDKL